jgi:hypothetical protein
MQDKVNKKVKIQAPGGLYGWVILSGYEVSLLELERNKSIHKDKNSSQ